MLDNFIINILDMTNIIYLWIILSRKNKDIIKFISSVITTSTIITLIEENKLNFIWTYIIILMVTKVIYKIKFKYTVFTIFLSIVLEISFQLVISFIVTKFINSHIIITVELLTLISIYFLSKCKFNMNITFEKIDSTIFIYFIMICSLYVIVFKITWNYDNNIILDNLFIVSIIFTLLVIAQVLIYLYIIKVIKEKEKLKITNEYNLVINEIVEEIKQRQHDFINYKNTIRGILEVGEEKELKSVLSKYINDECIYDNKINELIYIDNIVIRSIIYRSIIKAKEYSVNFKYQVENNVLEDILNYQEISNVLNNLLNNAFDEVLKNTCINKEVEISISNSNNISHIIVKNGAENLNNINLNDIFERGYSTKNSVKRGYGLYNIKQIVELHKGNIKINLGCDKITFDISF